MLSQIVNSFGLILGFIGAFILFWRAYPQPNFDGSAVFELEDNTFLPDEGMTVIQYKRKVSDQKQSYTNMAKTGLALIMIGFAFQLVATWLP